MRAMGADAPVRNRLVAVTVVLFAARVIVSVVRTGPVLVADEIGYLTNARVLTGGLPGQLSHAPYYRGGYSLLLAPLLKLSSDPAVVYHLVLVLNAALAASIVALLYLLLTRYAGVGPRAAFWPAVAGALYPSVTVFSQAALTEDLLFPLVIVWLIAVGGLLAERDRRRSLIWAAALGATGAALWIVHGRMISAVVLTVVVALWLIARRGEYPALTTAATVLAVLAAGLVAAHLLGSYLVDHNYGGHATNEANERVSALLGFHPLLTALGNLAGSLWYLTTSTFGLIAVVLAAAFSRRTEHRQIVFWLLALTALLLIVSAGAFPTRARPDMLIYGRYAEIVAPPLVALGLALVSQRGFAGTVRFRTFLLALAGLTGLVVLVRVTAANPGAASRWNVASLPFLTFGLGPAVLIGAAVVAGAGAWVLWTLRQRGWTGGRLALVVVGLFLPVIGYSVWNPVISGQRSVYPSGWTSPEPVARRLGIRTAAYDLAHYDVIGLYATQWFLPHTRLELFDSRRGPPPSRYVLSGEQWGAQHPGAVALWRDRGRNQVLWRLQ